MNRLCNRNPRAAVLRTREAGRGKREAIYEVPTIMEMRSDGGLGQTSVDGW